VVARVSLYCTIAGVVILPIQVVCSLLTFLVNPGMVKPEPIKKEMLEMINDNVIAYCSICRTIKKQYKNIYHCTYCDVCVEGFDHHCPWIGKCIGKWNKPFFTGFIGMTLILFFYTIFIGIACG
jgi:hypothetical protein